MIEVGARGPRASRPGTGSRSPAAASPTTRSSTSCPRCSARGSPTGSRRGSRLRDARRDRDQRLPARRGRGRLHRRGDRARPDRPARREDRQGRGLPRARASTSTPALELARAAGAEAAFAKSSTTGSRWDGGADAVLICAAAASNDPVELAAPLARDRAPVVVVGDVGMELPRAPFYEKELDLRLSRSYGPGRYDPDYELHGLDYPIGYVRWTEQRNMDAFLDLVADGQADPSELVTHRFAFDRGRARLRGADRRSGRSAIVLDYGAGRRADSPHRRSGARAPADAPARRGQPRFGLIGAGSFATATLIPGLSRPGSSPLSSPPPRALSAESARRRFGFEPPPPAPRRCSRRRPRSDRDCDPA